MCQRASRCACTASHRAEAQIMALRRRLAVQRRRARRLRRGARLHADADGPVARVGAARGLDRVVVDVDDLVQVARHDVRHVAQLVKLEVPARALRCMRAALSMHAAAH